MISFTNDYSEGAHPKVLELLVASNLEQNKGYGEDIHCDKAKEYIKQHIKREDVDIHFIPGGTQTNLLVISSFLRPHQCVIAADTGHINVHETGAIEATGHKVVTMVSPDGKLTPQMIQKALEGHDGEHMVQPKMVYISDTTELGTIYTKQELEDIQKVCQENKLLLFLDGARLASALTCKSNDLSIEDIARLVDVFYIGGTKNGALLGEALVICNEDLKEDFRFLIKQRGAMLAKGFVIGVQFETLFQPEELLYYELAKHANQMAEQLADAITACEFDFYAPVVSNQLFPVLPNSFIAELEKNFLFNWQAKVGEDKSAIRFVTSWATTQEQVDKLVEFFKAYAKTYRA
ncbi:MAG: aromatic amino acid beta-eliminating lyase/threonine aldolase [Herbinix sp.]|jgi:threonine aldolase|nr:aromatic amino acid beta-eliminating lyase/threonine aldolase [Herbinix sp.]